MNRLEIYLTNHNNSISINSNNQTNSKRNAIKASTQDT